MTKRADLTPALGWMGGPCKVVERIEDTVRTPSLREDLSEKVEHGQKLTNPEAAQIYTMEPERGGGLVKQIRITPHAQYRMDQRAITVGDLRVFFIDFSKKLGDWKSQKAWEWDHYAKALSSGEPIEWTDKRIGDLTVVFAASGSGGVNIVTTYWQGEADPRPGTCSTHPQHLHTARTVEDMSPVRTFVKDTAPSQSDTGKSQGESGKYPNQALPSPPWSRAKPTRGPTVLNSPGESGSDSSGTIHKDKVRTKGEPGGQYENGNTHPTPDVTDSQITPHRRPAMSAAERLAGMYAPAYPTGQTRHKKQRGQAYRYDHRRYKRQRGKIINRQKRRYKRLRNNGRFTLDRERRKDNPDRFKTKPSGGSKSIADRGKKQREKAKKTNKKASEFEPISFYHYDTDMWGVLLGVSVEEEVTYEIEGEQGTMDLDTFFDEVVVDEDRLDELLNYLDEVFEYDPSEGTDEDDTDEDDTDPLFDAWEGKSRTAYQRRRKQKGQARRKSRMDYMRNRQSIKRRSKARYRKMKNNSAFKRKQQLRRKHPERYKMRTALMLTIPDIAFVFITEKGLVSGTVRSVSDMSRQVSYWLITPGRQSLQTMTVDDFLLKAVFLSEEDTDKMFDLVDTEIGLEAYDLNDEEEEMVAMEEVEDNLERLASEVVADFMREQRPPDMSPDTKYDRADNHGEWGRSDRERLEDVSEYGGKSDGNPGSRVFPSEGAGHYQKQAALFADIREGCLPDLVAKGQKLSVKLRRVDARNSMWLFDVQGSKEPYRIRLQALRRGNTQDMNKTHVRVSCSCPFWRWQGPEHWAKQGDYLFGAPIGSASKPSIKDPEGQHRACKHVLAVMHMVTSKNWRLRAPPAKQASMRYLADTLAQGEVFLMPTVSQSIERVAARYLASLEVH